MSWKEENAIKRIFNTFRKLKSGIYKEDIEALKLLNKNLQERQNKAITGNILFAKILCTTLKQNVLYYQDIGFSIKNASHELDKTLDQHIEELVYHLNQIEMIKKSESGDLAKSDLLKNKKWSADQVRDSFYKTTNEFINDLNNYL